MTTLSHEVTWDIVHGWESYYSSAVLSGIVGDPAHQQSGGYHISIEDQSSSNYSVTRPDDKAPPGTWPRNLAAGIDMSMSSTDMKTCSDRLWWAWNDQTDPRRNYVNGFNGYFNDGGSAKRYDYVSQSSSNTTDDHKWHVHLEIRRRYVTDWEAATAIKSILSGEDKDQYLRNSGDDMGLSTVYVGPDGNPRTVEQMMVDVFNEVFFSHYSGEGRFPESYGAALQEIIKTLSTGSPDAVVVLEGVEKKLLAQQEFITKSLEALRKRIEDAVADSDEGGATKVRAELNTNE